MMITGASIAILSLILLVRFASLPVVAASVGIPAVIALQYASNTGDYETSMDASEAAETVMDTTAMVIDDNNFNVDSTVFYQDFSYDSLATSETLYSENEPPTFIGNWQYTKISKNGIDLASLESTDTLLLSNTGQFNYDIASLNKHEKGHFDVKDNTFTFRYLPVTTMDLPKDRYFQIQHSSYDSLSIYEVETQLLFEYRRK